MSEISLEKEIDYSNFVINDEKPKRNLILEDSCEFETVVENNGIGNLVVNVVVFSKSLKYSKLGFLYERT